jgi:hypothetical protein
MVEDGPTQVKSARISTRTQSCSAMNPGAPYLTTFLWGDVGIARTFVCDLHSRPQRFRGGAVECPLHKKCGEEFVAGKDP